MNEGVSDMPLLRTRFSRDELDYLSSVPYIDAPEGVTEPEVVDLVRRFWIGPITGLRVQYALPPFLEECKRRGCDRAQHIHNEHLYLRHGEMIARVERRWGHYSTEPPEVREAVEVLFAVIHEAECR